MENSGGCLRAPPGDRSKKKEWVSYKRDLGCKFFYTKLRHKYMLAECDNRVPSQSPIFIRETQIKNFRVAKIVLLLPRLAPLPIYTGIETLSEMQSWA